MIFILYTYEDYLRACTIVQDNDEFFMSKEVDQIILKNPDKLVTTGVIVKYNHSYMFATKK